MASGGESSEEQDLRILEYAKELCRQLTRLRSSTLKESMEEQAAGLCPRAAWSL